MIANKELVAAYDAWEKWTQREGTAIQDGNWRLVGECQKSKLELQDTIIRLTAAASTEVANAGLDPHAFDQNIRRIVSSLVALESRNAELLAARRQAARCQIAEIDHTCRNRKRVQRFYGQPSHVAWQSYS